LPIAFHLTGGEASDSRNFETMLDIGPDINPRAALGDKGYDSNQTARLHVNAEYVRQSRIDPTPKTFSPPFRRCSTRAAPVSSKQSGSSNGSSASRCVVRRQRGITVRSSQLRSASS
jgi:hypothetical protein